MTWGTITPMMEAAHKIEKIPARAEIKFLLHLAAALSDFLEDWSILERTLEKLKGEALL